VSDQTTREQEDTRPQGAERQSHARTRPPSSRDGYIDFYGEVLIGWVLCGWITTDWNSSIGEPEVELRFTNDTITGQAMMVLFQREDVESIGRGYIIVLPLAPRAAGDLAQVTLHTPAGNFNLFQSNPIERLANDALLERVRSVLECTMVAGDKGWLLAVLSRSAYAGMETLNRLKWPVLMELDETFFVPPAGLALRGWFLDPFDTVKAIRIRSAKTTQPLDRQDWLPIRRADVLSEVGAGYGVTNEECGFLTYAPDIFTPGDSIYIEIETKGGELGYKNVPEPHRQGLPAIEKILSELHLRFGYLTWGFDKVIGPAVTAINAQRLAVRPRVRAIAFGPELEAPRCSLIVPLYGRIDFMEYQLAFAPDTFTAEDELIYVLDDPRRTREAERLAQSCFTRFGAPFRLLLLDRNMGYAPANNIGVAHARGECVCFLNSDVIPKEPRWLELMLETLHGDSRIGVVGALLLFEDGSIQHEGAAMVPLPEFDNWQFPLHTNKGRKPAASAPVRTVDVVTAACMVMRRELLDRLGGMDERYVIGDFEDADICLRVRDEGLRCVVDNRAVLYHLERQSQNEANDAWRMNLTLFNAWQHRRRWLTGVVDAT
jgi:O-antigen biosynthesis protein